MEIDFVEHNEGVSSGVFANTGTYTDIYSGWVVGAARLGRNENSVSSIDKIAQTRIFHRVIRYHPVNDKSILRVLFERVKNNNDGKRHSFILSRSIPHKKNDNANVEQKNDDKVRELVGYHRYDTLKELDLLNKLYGKADILDNFFIPSAKLIQKQEIIMEGL